jgi:hypothetical protein
MIEHASLGASATSDAGDDVWRLLCVDEQASAEENSARPYRLALAEGADQADSPTIRRDLCAPHLETLSAKPSTAMRCYFMKTDRIREVEILMDRAEADAGKVLTDAEAIERARRLFAERTDELDGFEVWDRARMVIQHPPRQEK